MIHKPQTLLIMLTAILLVAVLLGLSLIGRTTTGNNEPTPVELRLFLLPFVPVSAPMEVQPVTEAIPTEAPPTEVESTPGLAPTETPLPCDVSGNFPKKVYRWCELITMYAAKFGVDSDLIASVIQVESGGNDRAYSKSGAVGLMQVMSKDGIAASFMCVNGPCFAKRPSMKQLYNPEFNIMYGTRMLARLIKKNGLRDGLRLYGPVNYGYRYADLVLAVRNKYGR